LTRTKHIDEIKVKTKTSKDLFYELGIKSYYESQDTSLIKTSDMASL